MPIKYNLTRYDILAAEIHKISLKNDSELTQQEQSLKAKATLIAAFASAHSWQTFRSITNGAGDLHKTEVRNEYEAAKTGKWKQVRNLDIQEVASIEVRDNTFFSWLIFNVDKDGHIVYKNAWRELKEELEEECDDTTSIIKK